MATGEHDKVPVTVERISNECDPIIIKREGKSYAVQYGGTATVLDLGIALEKLFNVPLDSQKLVGRGIGMIKMSSPKAHSKHLKDSAGKTVLFHGGLTEPVSRTFVTDCLENEKREMRAKELHDAQNRYNNRDATAAAIYNIDSRQKILDQEDLDAHPRFIRRVPGLGLRMVERFKRVLGRGYIPRLRCNHLPESTLLYGCLECIQRYFMDWYVFTCKYTFEELRMAKDMAGPNPKPEEHGFIEEIGGEMALLDSQSAEGFKLGETSPLSDILTDWVTGIIKVIDMETNHNSEISLDIKSFYTALEILEGGLGPDVYNGINSAHVIIDMRSSKGEV